MASAAAVHLGILAACVVLFVPMALAGLHLSRNKMLFFSGALFISLAVLVHLSPFLPSLPLLGPTTPSPPLPLSCLPFLHSLVHFLEPSPSFSFSFSRSRTCQLQQISAPDALLLLNGSSISVAGDSQSRLLVLSLLSLLLLDPASSVGPIHDALFRRHSDYHIQIPNHGITLDFLWSPFEPNVSSSFQSLNSNRNYPDIVVAGSGLWHMLLVNNATDYGKRLREIGEVANEIEKSPSSSSSSLHLFWIGLPTLVEEMLNTEEKRARMNGTMQEEYDKEVEKSGILRRDGGPFLLLDVGLLSRECGQRCTEDGMHYDKVVYDAAVQVMLNALLIESQQRV